ncbi:MAG: hypothetical protein C4574_06510 [Candidatus Latescibacterota bacterium]|nr:MAG: hypothetical protein C4574_06510 [Candidatus Latescibacterota bacterium]
MLGLYSKFESASNGEGRPSGAHGDPDDAVLHGRDGSDVPAVRGVASYLPNAFGLYDRHGNLWEWCNDWHADYRAASARILHRSISSASPGGPMRRSRGRGRLGKSARYFSDTRLYAQ